MDVEAMIRGTDPLGHREAAGIVVDLFKDWSQFCKEFAIQFYGANPVRRQGLSRCAWTTGPAARSTPKHSAPGRESAGRGAGLLERDTGDRHEPIPNRTGAAARGGAAGT